MLNLKATPQLLYPRNRDPVTNVQRLGGSQYRCGRLWNIPPPPVFESQTVQLAVSRYTNYDNPTDHPSKHNLMFKQLNAGECTTSEVHTSYMQTFRDLGVLKFSYQLTTTSNVLVVYSSQATRQPMCDIACTAH